MSENSNFYFLIIGSQANFSQDLLNLERETTPLRVLPSCPRNFKRTSVERYFREKGFAIDWCAFRLMTLDNQLSSEDTTAIYKELETTDNDDNEPEQVIINFDKPKKILWPKLDSNPFLHGEGLFVETKVDFHLTGFEPNT